MVLKKKTKQTLFECYLEEIPLAWSSQGDYYVFVEVSSKIKVVRCFYDKKAIVREFLLPDGIRVKCDTMLNEQQQLATNLTQACR